MSAEMISTCGSTAKLKHCLDRALKDGGYDPDMAHNWTLVWPSKTSNCGRPRILIEIEPRIPSRQVETTDD